MRDDAGGTLATQPVSSRNDMRLLTTTAVADLLSVPQGTIRYWRKVGLGPSWVKLEGSIRYTEEDVLQYIERNRRTPSVRAYMEETDAV
jgi:predicted DNA-binding transcriptional regulator AlpA